MFKNYFKIAVRNLQKNKIFSFINVFGLAMGLACCMLITVYVYDELSYDKYPDNAARIYRVELDVTGNGSVDTYPNVDVAVGAGIKGAFPEVEAFTRILRSGPSFVKYNSKQFKEQNLAFADSGFLRLFSIPLIDGDAQSALSEPNSIVITKAMANKYFNDHPAVGKSLKIGINTFKVTGLIDNVPHNSHFHFDAFMSMSTLHPPAQTWSNIGYYTYLLLNKDADPRKVTAKFPSLVAKHVVPEIQRDMGVSLAEAKKSVNTFKFFLQPLTGIHLHSKTKFELESNGDVQYVYIFGALAVFILLLACINFTNLSTAGAEKRAREVGVRKVLGSQMNQLISQFLTESVLLSYCAVFLAVILTYALMPYFNLISGKQINMNLFLSVPAVAVIIVSGLIVGILAGLYPAFFLSSFNTINILKRASSTSNSSKSTLRSGLVVFQFAVSTALIIATIVVYQQLNYMQYKKLGYDKEQVLFIEDTHELGEGSVQNAFKVSLLKDSRIVSASISKNVPGNPDMDGTQVYPKKSESGENHAEIHINIFRVDYDYIPTLGMKLKNGRNFSRDFPSDSSGVVINETAVKELGWRGTDPIGKTIIGSGQHQYSVIGVVSDFHYASVKQKIVPLMMTLGSRYGTGMIVKIKTAGVSGLLASIKNEWNAFNPGTPFSYYFLDEAFNALYASEQKTGQIFTAFAFLAIVIASLGLFGLATFIVHQRTKEMGIRKVFGASATQLLALLSKDFLVLVLIAVAIAVPVTWWGMNAWLADFAYRINISWWIFIAAGLIALVIALVTISLRAVKAAVSNPIKSLRTE